jgi:hypothetical protein
MSQRSELGGSFGGGFMGSMAIVQHSGDCRREVRSPRLFSIRTLRSTSVRRRGLLV